ncbi:TerC/Alx family metal homeostasis membrane protein [Actinomadura sp. DC4]|uniref:TerC/Alx family metal homeostasis membrane protein n=1 Tax=Actinomadura sp. DC4 TaxID=3055069 RepID=UPI0025B151D1|nr:TerC/Alx family metal homeostasis membrane protein [Actinomadura sp. DC4]MDN3351828.1 TerC/Alx family metal homeostasis membrane protein [Actinomadura sp. DC4]
MPHTTPSVASPLLWAVTLAGVLFFFAVDFVITRRPHAVRFREALAWTGFYLALPVLFAVFTWLRFGSETAVDYFTGYLVEKSLSVDNLFVFMLLIAAFAVPAVLTQRVLLYGIAGALVLRGIFIAIGAAAVQTVAWTFLIFGGILLFTAVKILRDTVTGANHEVDVSSLRSVRLVRRFMPVTDDYQGPNLTARQGDRRALTPLALVVIAVFGTDLVFAVDSIPAVYGVTQDPYLVFTANAFSLFGLRALYFVLQSTLSKLIHLGYGLAVILAFIGVKLILHWAHGTWKWLPEIPTPVSLAVIVVTLATVTLTSLYAGRRTAPAVPDRADLSHR